MKLIFSFLLVLVPFGVVAQPPITPPVIIVEIIPTLDDYESALTHYKKRVKESFDFAAWKNVELTHKKTKDTIKFDKLSNFDKHVFCLMSAEKLTDETSLLKRYWDAELLRFDDPKFPPPGPKSDDPKKQHALKKDVEKYHKELQDLRKSFASAYETFAGKTFKDFQSEIPEKERELFLKKILEIHDKEKLVERK